MVAVAVGLGLVASATNVTTSRTQAGQVAVAINAAAKPGDVVGYCPDQLGPSVSHLLPSTLVQLTFPAGQPPQRVDWYDYGARNAAGQPPAFAQTLAARAGPGHNIWYVWIGGYKTLDFKCEAVINQLADLRHGATGTGMILTANGQVLTNAHVVSGARTVSVTQVVRPDTKGPQQPRQCLRRAGPAPIPGGAVDGPWAELAVGSGQEGSGQEDDGQEGSGQKDRGQEDDGQAAVASSNLVGPGASMSGAPMGLWQVPDGTWPKRLETQSAKTCSFVGPRNASPQKTHAFAMRASPSEGRRLGAPLAARTAPGRCRAPGRRPQ